MLIFVKGIARVFLRLIVSTFTSILPTAVVTFSAAVLLALTNSSVASAEQSHKGTVQDQNVQKNNTVQIQSTQESADKTNAATKTITTDNGRAPFAGKELTRIYKTRTMQEEKAENTTVGTNSVSDTLNTTRDATHNPDKSTHNNTQATHSGVAIQENQTETDDLEAEETASTLVNRVNDLVDSELHTQKEASNPTEKVETEAIGKEPKGKESDKELKNKESANREPAERTVLGTAHSPVPVPQDMKMPAHQVDKAVPAAPIVTAAPTKEKITAKPNIQNSIPAPPSQPNKVEPHTRTMKANTLANTGAHSMGAITAVASALLLIGIVVLLVRRRS